MMVERWRTCRGCCWVRRGTNLQSLHFPSSATSHPPGHQSKLTTELGSGYRSELAISGLCRFHYSFYIKRSVDKYFPAPNRLRDIVSYAHFEAIIRQLEFKAPELTSGNPIVDLIKAWQKQTKNV
jgi:hypothetical protein